MRALASRSFQLRALVLGPSPWIWNLRPPRMWNLREPSFLALSNTHLGQSCWSQTHKHHEGSSSRENTLALRLWSPRRQVTASCQSFFSILASEFSPFNRKIKWCIRKFPQCQFLKTKLRTKFFDQNNKWPIESRRGSCGPWRIHAEEELRDIYRKLNSNSKLEFYQCSPLLLPFTKSHFIKCLLLDKYQI